MLTSSLYLAAYLISSSHLLGVVDRFMCCAELEAGRVAARKIYERCSFVPQRAVVDQLPPREWRNGKIRLF